MAITLPNWLTSYFQRSTTNTYQPINNQQDIENNNLPGSYPSETDNQQLQHENFQKLHNILSKLTHYFNYIVIQPIIILLIIIFRLFSKLFNVLYFKDSTSDDPISKVNKFILNLEDNLTTKVELPPFYQGSYTQALYMATQRGKFLFVFLNNYQNENSTNYHSIITNKTFLDLFKEYSSDILIWGGDLTNPESYQLANSLNVSKFPFLGLLCLTRQTQMTPEGPKKTPSKISLIGKIQGSIKANNDEEIRSIIENKFIKKINKYSEELKLIKFELQNKYMSKIIQKQQEINYENSLMKDKIKKQKQEYEKLYKEYLIYNIPKYEKYNQQSDDCAKIAIKLKNGNRITCYIPSNMKIIDIFIYLDLLNKGYFNNKLTSNLTQREANEKFKDLDLRFDFNLISPLPPKISLIEIKDTLIKDCNLIYPNGLLIVE
ncbi:unnamed protein product [Candida verbasci]|uniref:UAS domain-containing protein n=1 Tax=Candida verbasci TaxID=1227364 RepID=A0A9W4TYU8_9ASCO|nr:unnamed protein product [Candida verbasci]